MKLGYKANHRFKIKKRVTYHKLLFSFCGAYRTRTDHLDTASQRFAFVGANIMEYSEIIAMFAENNLLKGQMIC